MLLFVEDAAIFMQGELFETIRKCIFIFIERVEGISLFFLFFLMTGGACG